jgi:hypothetical protein
MIREMHTDFSRTVWMKFPNQQNENVAPNPSRLFTLAQCQHHFWQHHQNNVLATQKLKTNFKTAWCSSRIAWCSQF